MGKGSGRGGNAYVSSSELNLQAKAESAAEMTMIIDGRMYDISNFDHPGGDTILDAVGEDATAIFFTTHPVRVWKLLRSKEFERKHLVPEPEAVQQKRRDQNGGYNFHCEFHLQCKKIVADHLAERAKRYGKHFDSAIVATWSSLWVIIPLLAYWNMLRQGGTIFSAVLTGLAFAGGNFNLMHPSMHGGICRFQPFKAILDQTYTVFSGGSCPVWRQRHNCWHHGHTNTARDTDKDSHPFLRLHPNQPKKWWFAYQHLYFVPLALINITISQFLHVAQMWNTVPTPVGTFRRCQCNMYWAALMGWIGLAYIIPVYSFGAWTALSCALTFQIVGSGCATYNIVINHVFEGAHTAVESYGKSFAKMQCASAANHSAGSMLAAFLSGGLNHQLEHHLFPSLAVHHYPLICAKIEAACKKHKVKYTDMSYLELVVSMHKTLFAYGVCDESAHLPGLGDYHELMSL